MLLYCPPALAAQEGRRVRLGALGALPCSLVAEHKEGNEFS